MKRLIDDLQRTPGQPLLDDFCDAEWRGLPERYRYGFVAGPLPEGVP